MKEAQDLLRGLKSQLDDAAQQVEDMDSFDQKADVLSTIDNAFNEISYRLTEMS